MQDNIFSKKFRKTSSFDRALGIIIFFLLSQLADIQYFDGKISLIAWIFLAALKNNRKGDKTHELKNVYQYNQK